MMRCSIMHCAATCGLLLPLPSWHNSKGNSLLLSGQTPSNQQHGAQNEEVYATLCLQVRVRVTPGQLYDTNTMPYDPINVFAGLARIFGVSWTPSPYPMNSTTPGSAIKIDLTAAGNVVAT